MENEVWRPVVGWEGFYSVSNLGRVRSEKRIVTRRDKSTYLVNEKTLSLKANSRGYYYVTLRKPARILNVAVHRIVAEAFFGPLPLGMVTRHGIGGKLDNSVINLAYGTKLENAADKIRDGTHLTGERHPRSKLTEASVSDIRAARNSVSQRELAKKYDIDKATVYKIQKNKIWTHATSFPLPQN